MGCPGRGEKRREEGGLSLAVDRKASIAHRHRILFRYCENHRTPKSEKEKWPRHRPSFRDSHVAEATGEFSGKNFFPPLLLTSFSNDSLDYACDDYAPPPPGKGKVSIRREFSSFLSFFRIKEKSNWEI